MGSHHDAPTTSNTYPLFSDPTNKIVISSEEENEKEKQLGDGAQGIVLTGTLTNGDTREDKKVAVKKTMTTHARQAKNEIHILEKLGKHKHIVTFIGYYCDENRFLQVMGLCSKGDLHQVFNNRLQSGKGALNAHEALYTTRQIFSAVDFCHWKNIIHGDIKLENILVETETSTPEGSKFGVVMCDFGHGSELVKHGDFSSRSCGTREYWAPEIAKCFNKRTVLHYDTKVDIWCVGVMLFIMLKGAFPSEKGDTERTIPGDIPSFPNNLNLFLQGLLMIDPKQRLTIKQCRDMAKPGPEERRRSRKNWQRRL